jgi:N-acetylglutamate synthase-like GNAT family acetyltransferase
VASLVQFAFVGVHLSLARMVSVRWKSAEQGIAERTSSFELSWQSRNNRRGRQFSLCLHFFKFMETCTADGILTSGIRLAESKDIGRLIELVWANVEEGPYKKKIVFKEHTLRMFVGALLADEKARFLVYEHDGKVQGAFAFTTFPNYFYFAGQIVASMVVWSVAKPFRGRVSMKLLRRAKIEARELDAKYLVVNGATEKFASLCKHCGFSFLESSHIMELN